MKKCLLTVLCAVFSVCMMLALFTNSFSAKANEQQTPYFRMSVGASVKLTSDGIRFRVEMDETHVADIKDAEKNLDLYFIISPESIFNAVENKDYYNLVAENKCYFIPVDESKIYADNGVYYANGCIYEVKDANRKIEFCAVAVILDNTDTQNPTVYKYADLDESADYARSLYNTLNASMEEFTGELSVVDSIMDVYGSWLGSEKYPIEIKNVEQYNDFVAYINENSSSDKIYVNVYNLLTSTETLTASNVVITNLLSTPQDFSTFMLNVKNKVSTYSNQTVKLANDIDMSSYVGAGGSESFNGNATGAMFKGVLDGDGYTVSNFKTNYCVFKCIENATIKNIALKFVLKTGEWFRGFVSEINSGTFDNVYLRIDSYGNSSNDFTLAYRMNNGVLKVKNTIIDRPNAAVKKLLNDKDANATISFENSYVIGNITSIGVSDDKVIGNPISTAQNALKDIIIKGFTAENGWSDKLWSLKNDALIYSLSYGDTTLITSENYWVATPQDFQLIVDNVRNGVKSYYGTTVELIQDIDFTGYTYPASGYLTGQSSSDSSSFNGTLNGNGYAIKNLKVRWNLFYRSYNAIIKNIAFINLEMQNGWGMGLIQNFRGEMSNVYVKSTSNGVYNQDYALFSAVTGPTTVSNCIISRSHGVTGYLVETVYGNASLTLTNTYVIGSTYAIYLTSGGPITYTNDYTALYRNDAQGALSALTTAGGFTSGVWSIDESGNLLFSDYTVIAKAA